MHGFWVGPAAGDDAPAARLDLAQELGGDTGRGFDARLVATANAPRPHRGASGAQTHHQRPRCRSMARTRFVSRRPAEVLNQLVAVVFDKRENVVGRSLVAAQPQPVTLQRDGDARLGGQHHDVGRPHMTASQRSRTGFSGFPGFAPYRLFSESFIFDSI